MRLSVERIRAGVLVLAGALLVGVLLLFLYARWKIHRIARDLPQKLGIEIQQSSQGFTFSKSQGGHTLFTLHAAKTVQYKGTGHASLHDVSINLYDPNGLPADRIYGSDFDYDPANGIVLAKGAVEIDLSMPGNAGLGASAQPGSAGRGTIHVKTSDLVFNQKTGVASTPQPLEFHLTQASGTAVGANFDSSTGVLILTSDVSLVSSVNGKQLSVHARHAQYDRTSRLLYLLSDVVDDARNHGSSDQATVYFRPDGSASRTEAKGHVHVLGDMGQQINAPAAHITLDQKSRPEQVTLDGGVVYLSDDPLRRLHGTAGSMTLAFGPQSAIRNAQLRIAASVLDEEKPQGLGKGGRAFLSLTREVRAEEISLDFLQEAGRRPMAQHILASGGARVGAGGRTGGGASMVTRTIYSAGSIQETAITGDRLLADLRDGVALSTLEGDGHTGLAISGPGSIKQASTGDKLLLTFAPASTNKKSAAAPPGSQPVQLQSGRQIGNVTLVQNNTQAAQSSSAPNTLTATAARADYDGLNQILRLYGDPATGDPRIRDASGEITAAAIEFAQSSGDATATGRVKATYRHSPAQPGISLGGSEATHIVADHAHLDHSTDLTVFYGAAAENARLWQGADSVSAPVLELSRPKRTLDAHGFGGAAPNVVTAVFSNAGRAGVAKPAAGAAGPANGSVMRVESRGLLYSSADNKAVFRGGVLAQTASGSVRSNQMEVFLAPPPGPGQNPAPNLPEHRAQQVDRIVAQGNVELLQPGRKGSGEELVYTAQDGRFVLTGTSSQLPHLFDQVRGTVTGNSLIFNDRDDSVVVSGGPTKAVTETHTAK